MKYELEHFAGPLEILLKLVERKEFPLEELALLKLCEQLSEKVIPLEPALSSPSLSASESAEHILSFGQLAESKLVAFSPSSEESLEKLETSEAFDWFDGIQEYALMKLGAQELFKRQAITLRRYPKGKQTPISRLRPLTWEELQPLLNKIASKSVKVQAPAQMDLSEESGPSIGECMQQIWHSLEQVDRLSLSSLFESQTQEVVISYFLALLELFKAHRILVVIDETLAYETPQLWILKNQT